MQKKNRCVNLCCGRPDKRKVNCEGDCDYIVHAAAVTASKVMVSDPVGTIVRQLMEQKNASTCSGKEGESIYLYFINGNLWTADSRWKNC